MKKKIIIIIITIAVICGGIALAFMGGGTKDIKKGTKNKENIINVNEQAKGENLAITFTEFETPKDDLGKGSYKMNRDNSYEYTKDGYVNRLAHFKIENIGNSEVYTKIDAVLNYRDGYTFNAEKKWYYSKETYSSDLKTQGRWVNNELKITPFDEPVECVVAFLIPEEVANGTDSLSLTLKVDNKQYVINIR